MLQINSVKYIIFFNFQALEPENAKLNVPHQEVVLMVGVQGSGKSHFAEMNFGKAGYVIVSNDKTGGKEKSLNLMKKCLGKYLIDIFGGIKVMLSSDSSPSCVQKFV